MQKFIKYKYFSKKDNLFHVIISEENAQGKYIDRDETSSNFEEFYKGVNKDLSNANLLEYDFDDCDPSEFNLANAKLSSKTMRKLGVYNDKYFKMIDKDRQFAVCMRTAFLDKVPDRELQNENEISKDKDYVIYYISDLHINYKLVNKFKESTNRLELYEYLDGIIETLHKSLFVYKYNSYVVFVGDISYNFEIFKLFFKRYRKQIALRTFVVLGNHELWDLKLNARCKSLESIIEKYRCFLSELGIILLENQLFIPNDEQKLYSEQDIINLSDDILRQKIIQNSFIIFGGLGYAGLNEEFNSNNGIYKTKYLNREEEKKRSLQISRLHDKLKKVAFNKQILFVTHMPKNDWSNTPYVKNWIYLSGHTHKNYCAESEEIHIYADNQIGYLNTNFNFKYIITSAVYNIFQDLRDGIHEISQQAYCQFYYGLRNYIKMNRTFDHIYLIKKRNIYCFMAESNNRLQLLNGGLTRKVGNNDLKYFYDNIVNYADSIKVFLDSYSNYQSQIAKEIKKIGGSGTIHGCIIDIDFYNHLYVNPFDALITAYFARSIKEKYVFKNVRSLLKCSCAPQIYSNFLKQLDLTNDNNTALTVLFGDVEENDECFFVEDTYMYKISRIVKSLQYITGINVVRIWNEDLVKLISSEIGKEIISQFLKQEELVLLNNKLN